MRDVIAPENPHLETRFPDGAGLGGFVSSQPTPRREGCFCVRFVFSPGEVTFKGGWAGGRYPRRVRNQSMQGTLPPPAGDTVGSAHPKGGGRARPE